VIDACDIESGMMFSEFAAIDGAPHAENVTTTESLTASLSAKRFWRVMRQHETRSAPGFPAQRW
jgi:CRP-like cAMP-binding protein